MGFDERAKSFDTDLRKERAKVIAKTIREAVSKNGLSAMEFGCGTGLIGMELVDLFREITFVDSSIGMIEQLQEKIQDVPHARVAHVDLTREAWCGPRVDCVFTSMVLHHIVDTEAILRTLYGVLADGGILLAVDLDEDVGGRFHAAEEAFDGHDGFSQQAFCELCRKVGFAEVGSETFYWGIKDVDGNMVPYSLFLLKARRA